MPLPVGLDMWELITVSALCAFAALGTFGTIAVSIAYLLTREPKPAAAPAAAVAPTAPAVAVAPALSPAPIVG